MKTKLILTINDQNSTLERVGGKGASLAQMAAAGLPVPGGFHVTTEAYRHFVAENGLQPQIPAALENIDYSDLSSLKNASQAISKMFTNAQIPTEVANAVVQAYATLPGMSPAVAVRSSATAEDLPDASFAGQQETYLNVSGAEDVLEAIHKCWSSLWTARAIAYRARQNIDADGIALAVVVQLLVPAEAAGIMFTANPVNGSRDQIVVNASWGLGEAVVGGLVTPDTLTLEKSSGNVIIRETAEKLVQTVQINGGTEEKPISPNLRRVPVINDQQAAELVQLGNTIEDLYDMPMDIEWTLADGKFAIVQARPITVLPEPKPPTPTEWKLPKGVYSAIRNNIVELMIDPLTPLFRTFGLNAVNTSMGNLLSSFFGDSKIMPDNLIITVNEYAYYNGSIKMGAIFKILFNSPKIMKRMFTGAVERWTEEGHPRYVAIVERWQNEEWQELPNVEILLAARELSEAAIDAYGVLVGGVLPAAWITEGLFMMANTLVKRRKDPTAPTYLMGFDSIPIHAEKSLYEISEWVRQSEKLSVYLKETPTLKLAVQLDNGQIPENLDAEDWREWQHRFKAHLKVFGHFIYNLDFATPVPADNPAPLLEALKMFISGQGTNPHTRQQATAERRKQATQSMQKRLKGIRLNIFKNNLDRAQRFAPLREDGLADVGLSYPLLRQMLREVGRRFAESGMIEEVDDIFWLKQDEVEDAVARLDRDEVLENLSAAITQRKAIRRAARRAEPPIMLPNKILGLDISKIKSRRVRKGNGDVLKGVAASPGRVTAPACVMNGPEDFAQMKVGDVLVASITTPAWTPLFARASAIVTDIGGPLSHGSIVAREYGLPAVLGTGAATKSIRSGQVITVDGDEGKVLLTNE